MSAKNGQVFDAVAEGSRREILDLLAGGPRPVGEIAAETGLSQPNASRHLRILREAGLVEPRVEGQRRIYELRPAGLAELMAGSPPTSGSGRAASTRSNATSTATKTTEE